MRSVALLAWIVLLGVAGCVQLQNDAGKGLESVQKEAAEGLDNAAKVPKNIWNSNKK